MIKISQNYIAHLLLAILIVILPLYLRITPMEGVNLLRVSKDDFFTVCSIVLGVLFVGRNRVNPAFYLHLLFIVPLLILNNYNPASSSPIMQTIYIVAGICLTLKLAMSFDEKYEHIILNGIVVSALIQCLFGLLEWFGFPAVANFYSLFFNGTEKRIPIDAIYGTLGNPNIYGAFLAMSGVAFFRIYKVRYILPLLFCLFLSQSTLAAVTFIVAAAAYFGMEYIQKNLKWVMGITGFLYLNFIIQNPFNIANGRFNILATIFDAMTPLQRVFGTGPGWLWDAHLKIGDTLYRQDHSEPFAIYRITGIAGIGLFFYLMHKALKETNHRIFFAMLCASLFNSMGNFNLHTSPTALIFLVAIAGCIATREA
jgi:hypothetical protein